MEAMFDLATQPPAIDDAPAAVSLQTGPGRIEFRDVHFGYGDGRQLLQGVSFAGSIIHIYKYVYIYTHTHIERERDR